MDERKIRDAIALLEHEVPREGARVKLAQYGGGPDESQILANELGFLRLGVEFLKAAYAPTDDVKTSDSVKLDIDYLLTRDSSISFNWVERCEPRDECKWNTGGAAAAVVISVLLGIVILAVIGLVAVGRWFVG